MFFLNLDYSRILSVTVFIWHEKGNVYLSFLCTINYPVLYTGNNKYMIHIRNYDKNIDYTIIVLYNTTGNIIIIMVMGR